MTDDLGQSKRQLEEAYLDLQDKHTELEDRRRYIETVLEAITTGVVSFDPLGRVTTINRAAARMFGIDRGGQRGPAAGGGVRGARAARDRHPGAAGAAAARRARGAASCTCARAGVALSLLASATALRGPRTASTRAPWWSSTTSPSCSRRSGWRPGARWPSASPTRSRTRSRRSSSPPSACAAGSAGRRRGPRGWWPSAPRRSSRRSTGCKRLVDEFSRFARMPALVPAAHRRAAASSRAWPPLSRLPSRPRPRHPPRRRPAAAARWIPITSSARC